ncbi:MAG: hypothetical protein AB7G11_04830 [Phycisphaerales bacterium]
MSELSARNFGLVISYLIPGFVALGGLSLFVRPLAGWLMEPSAAGMLFVLISSVAAGMTASAVRWAVVDTILHASGVRRPNLDFSQLPGRLEAFDRLNEFHYQYYQFYANTLVAGVASYTALRSTGAGSAWLDVAVVLLAGVFAAGARDALRKFYSRSALLLGESEFCDDERNRSPRRPDAPHPKEAGARESQAANHAAEAQAPEAEVARVVSDDITA